MEVSRAGVILLWLPPDRAFTPAATSNKIATSFSNGAVVLWDLARDGNRIGGQTELDSIYRDLLLTCSSS